MPKQKLNFSNFVEFILYFLKEAILPDDLEHTPIETYEFCEDVKKNIEDGTYNVRTYRGLKEQLDEFGAAKSEYEIMNDLFEKYPGKDPDKTVYVHNDDFVRNKTYKQYNRYKK